MLVSVPRETCPGERRVALTPVASAALIKARLDVLIESGAGLAAGFTDQQYEKAGAKIAAGRSEIFEKGDIVAQVRTFGANSAGEGDVALLRSGQLVIGHADPLIADDPLKKMAEKGATLLAMELVPRITRAQAMDALSSQANLAGYKAVILAAEKLGKIFPMLMTAAGTIQATRVLIVGVGVAGLQAIATARRLGGIVSAYDVRPAVKEQVQSLGAKFVELPLDTSGAQDKGGYAKEQSEEQIRKQQELMGNVVAESDVVITTALIPGKPAPKLVTAAMVERMQPGSVIVDLAAERGGNCELTDPDKVVEKHGVTIIGTANIAATVAHHASQMYANNIVQLLKLIVDKEGKLKLDTSDEIVAAMLISKDGQIVHPGVKSRLGI
jgi:H+-translocating NAD(P) transhydrogenase subunit alpha